MATNMRDLPLNAHNPHPTKDKALISVVDDRISVDCLELTDRTSAEFLRNRPEDTWPTIIADSLKVGLVALTHAGLSVNVDYIQKEFQRLTGDVQSINQQAASTLLTALRDNFADGNGRLPRALESYLGSDGQVAQILQRASDPQSQTSLVGQMKVLLGSHFDGDESKLARLLDPAREGGPLNPLFCELRRASDRLVALEAATSARQRERQLGTAKGSDHEDSVEPVLGTFAASMGDALECTAHLPGLAGTLAGDFVLTVNPSFTQGLDAKLVVETKDTKFALSKIEKELAEARHNRGATVAIAVFTPGKLPAGYAPLTMHGTDLYCEFDPKDTAHEALEWAVRLARIAALRASREATVQVDAEAVRVRVGLIRRQLQVIKGVKAKLTSIGRCSDEIAADLSEMRATTEMLLTEMESELTPAQQSVG